MSWRTCVREVLKVALEILLNAISEFNTISFMVLIPTSFTQLNLRHQFHEARIDLEEVRRPCGSRVAY